MDHRTASSRPNRRRASGGAAVVAASLLLSACAAQPETITSPALSPSAAPAPSPTADALEPVAPSGDPVDVTTGLEAPWSVAFVGETAIVSERDSGRILELADDGSTREVTTVEGVVTGGEGGLLGLTVDDDERLYVYSTGSDGNRIERYSLTGEPGALGVDDPETILDGIPSARTHNGGRLAIGPDGLLYASVGDAGNRDAPQDPDALGGKILRMTLDGGVPDDNPIEGSLVYSLGHRNVQGLAWAEDGTMFATEFGQDTWDELNLITPGANYGWPVVEGVVGRAEFTDPLQQWNPDDASPSGLAVVGGTLFVANLRGEVLRSVPLADTTSSTDYLSGEFGRLRDVVEAPDGSLWVVTNNTDGRGEPTDGDDRILRLPLSPAP
ncbi:glucose/arabinose dehydrogenase [Labedella gwakjiensis]|uniref:Glucose/arabinose dehydrogenase n=1 Tax=Labedella gwakjiensis TaxID=390269 RepID=A0A2P8GYZ1_9MICO|nr:PQQ-dependent sugar dehydrogenase [Labedella gwakjiensis]PSL39183.1 glucose/arabinose dehydrogenase [Labedella gwakjiensis]RUQ86385.1 PQQ-dependent sugar dehydrogenase [Labedella gwakjiensis]